MVNGAFQATGNPLDVAISGDGWLRVGLGEPDRGQPDGQRPDRRRAASSTPARATSRATTRAT